MLIYTAGPYSRTKQQEEAGKTEAEAIRENIATARQWAITLLEAGHMVFCPHLNTAGMEVDCKLTWTQYIDADLKLLARCDAIFMLPHWDNSKGAIREHDFAHWIGMPVFYYELGAPTLHPTEVRCPGQVQAFEIEIGRMMRTHLKKNADYSPANILGTGTVGLVTRIWDKCARLMNLSGFSIDIASSKFDGARQAQNESLSDSFDDLAVYAVIGKLLLSGKWGS